MLDDATKGFLVFLLLAVGLFPSWNPVRPPLWLGFAGDLMAPPEIQTQDPGLLYAGAEPWLRQDQLNFINVETSVDPSLPLSDYPAFNAHTSYVLSAIRAGFNVFNLANNHANDYGWKSVRATLTSFQSLQAQAQIAFSGLRQNPQGPFLGAVIEKDGWRIGFLSMTSLVNQPIGEKGVNFLPYHPLWDDRDDETVRRAALAQVRAFRRSVDWLVVGLHDGKEYDTQLFPWQKRFYDALAKAGADVVWVQHPHVLRPWWVVKTSRGRSLVLSSMGNFVSGQTRTLGPEEGGTPRADTGDSCLFRIRLVYRNCRLEFDALRPVLLTQAYDASGAERIVPTQKWAAEGPLLWRGYFQDRLEHQRAWARSGRDHGE